MILYNPATHKQEWHTVNGTRRDAEAFERQQKTRQASGVYIAKAERRTFAEVAEMFLKERRARNRRTSTLVCYETVLNRHLLPAFGPHEVGAIRRQDIAERFDAMREGKARGQEGKPASVQTTNRALRAMKAVLFFALERELVERNVMQRFRPFEGDKNQSSVNVERANIPTDLRAEFEHLGENVITHMFGNPLIFSMTGSLPKWAHDNREHALAWLREQQTRRERREDRVEAIEMAILVLVAIEAIPILLHIRQL